jgi:hypothetical protein
VTAHSIAALTSDGAELIDDFDDEDTGRPKERPTLDANEPDDADNKDYCQPDEEELTRTVRERRPKAWYDLSLQDRGELHRLESRRDPKRATPVSMLLPARRPQPSLTDQTRRRLLAVGITPGRSITRSTLRAVAAAKAHCQSHADLAAANKSAVIKEWAEVAAELDSVGLIVPEPEPVEKVAMSKDQFATALAAHDFAVGAAGWIVDTSGTCPGFKTAPVRYGRDHGNINREATIKKIVDERNAEIQRRAIAAKPHVHQCQGCGKSFRSKRVDARFCPGSKCRTRAYRADLVTDKAA